MNKYTKSNIVSRVVSPTVTSKNKGTSISNSYISYKIHNSELKSPSSKKNEVSQFFENFYKENKSLVLSEKYLKESSVDTAKQYELNMLEKIQKRSLRQSPSEKKNNYLNKVYCLLKNKDNNYLEKRKNMEKVVFSVDFKGNPYLTFKNSIFKPKEKNVRAELNFSTSLSNNNLIEKNTNDENNNLFKKITEFHEENNDITNDEDKTDTFMDKFKLIVDTDNSNESDFLGQKEVFQKMIKKNIGKSQSEMHINKSENLKKNLIQKEFKKIKTIQTVSKDTRVISLNNSPKSSVKLPPLINLVYNRKIHRKEFKEKDGIKTRINFMDSVRTKLLSEIYSANLNIKFDELPVLQGTK